jgi:hypothetical protein
MVRTRIHDDQGVDEDFLSESELNEFFSTVVITGTNGRDDTALVTTFDEYFPGRGLITAGSGITIVTGTNFVEITSTASGSGSGISLEDHETIDSFVHNLAETSITEIIRNPSNQVSNVNVRTVAVTGTLIRSTAISRVGGKVTDIVENQHDDGGTITQTLTSTINRVGTTVVSIDVVET